MKRQRSNEKYSNLESLKKVRLQWNQIIRESGIIPQGLYSFLKSNEDFVKVIRNLETDFEKKTSYENFVKTPAEKSRMNRIQIDLEKEILASDEKWKVPEIMFGSEANEFSCDFAPESCPPALSNFGKEIILFFFDFYRHRN